MLRTCRRVGEAAQTLIFIAGRSRHPGRVSRSCGAPQHTTLLVIPQARLRSLRKLRCVRARYGHSGARSTQTWWSLRGARKREPGIHKPLSLIISRLPRNDESKQSYGHKPHGRARRLSHPPMANGRARACAIFAKQCCDCDLIHRLDFRLVDGRIQFRTRRDKEGEFGFIPPRPETQCMIYSRPRSSHGQEGRHGRRSC
jgi:hypothetical protein